MEVDKTIDFSKIDVSNIDVDTENNPPKGDDKPADNQTPKDDATDTPPTDDKTVDDKGDDTPKDDSTPPTSDDAGDDDKGDDTATDDQSADITIYTDDKGDYVDKDGNVIVKKEDAKFDEDGNLLLPEDLIQDSVVDVVKNKLINDFGFEFNNDEGKPIDYPDTDEGMASLVTDAIKRGVIAERNAMFEQYPHMQTFYNHILAGKDPGSYFTQAPTKWTNYQLPSNDDTSQQAVNARKNVIKESFKTQFGYYDADGEEQTSIENRAQAYADMMEDTGKLGDESQNALKDLVKAESKAAKVRDDANKAAIEAEEQNRQQYWNGVTDTINSGDLKGLQIPKDERQAFLDYVSKDVTGKGQTQEMLDMNNEDIALGLQLAYMRFKKFDLNALIKVKATAAQAVNLRQRRAKVRLVKGDKDGLTTSKSAPDLSKIKLSNLI